MNEIILWKTCRVLANETRLNILKRLLRGAALCVSDIAALETSTRGGASQHLRHLHERGFIQATRQSKWTFYRFEPDAQNPIASKLAIFIEKELKSTRNKIPQLIQSFTAFTHPRRIHIVKTLCIEPSTEEILQTKCSISIPALHRHLNKLSARGIILKDDDHYRINPTTSGIEKVLIEACSAAENIHTL